MPETNIKSPGLTSEKRPTEDDRARANLGGSKGSRKLPPAPLTRQKDEQMAPNDEPGHVA